MDRRPKDSWGPWGAGGSRYRGLRFKASLLGALLLLFGAASAADVNAVLMNGRLSAPAVYAGTGYHSIGLVNHTAETAMFHVYRLSRGASVDDLMAADAALQAADGEDVITALEQVADEAQALSGASVSGFSDEQLVVDLERGTYAVVATPSDGSAPQWATFRVTEGGDEAVDEPQARYDAELSGSSFDMPETVVTGENLWKLSSTGDQPLVVSFYRLLPGSTADDLLAYLGAGGGQGRQPYDESESFVAVTPGASAIVTLDLEAGDWVAVRNAAPAPTAAAEEAAMIAEFRVD